MRKRNRFLPMALNLEGKKLLIVGGGPVAFKRFEQWRERGAQIIVVARRFSDRFKNLEVLLDDVSLLERDFVEADLLHCALVYLATDDEDLNDHIEALCHQKGIWCGRGDTKDSDVLSLSLIEQGSVQIGIGTSGKSPAMAKQIRETLSDVLDLEKLESRIELMDELKRLLKKDIKEQKQREVLLRKALGLTIEDLERLLTDEAIYSRFKG